MTLDEFIAWEANQPTRYEFVDGKVIPLANESGFHSTIITKLTALIVPHLKRHRPCRLFSPNMLVESATATRGRRPDLSVSCDERDVKDLSQVRIRYPKLLIEVISPESVKRDQEEKLKEYLALPSLEEYVLIDSRHRSIEAHRRFEGTWFYSLPVREGIFIFTSIGLPVALDDIYDQELTAAKPERKKRKKPPDGDSRHR
ncbi:MAG TPA: Uma2 family endonuclease [Candidatus Baltobacteraceae bacterium]|jgi:Uma2 family endonuclease|nr:Uma2 family endonuclease [Candidatus Baltobacteraceae bacterium]